MLELLERSLTDEKTEIAEKSLGLSTEEAQRRLGTDGENALKKSKKKNVAGIFVGQFRDIMVMILLAATAISAILGEVYDALTIILIVLINAILGFIQEFRTEKTLETLERLTAPTAKVYRDGKLVRIAASEIVAGDVFELEAGDRVPCDGFVISQSGGMCDESILTGEAVPVSKTNRINELAFDRLNLPYVCYMGTIVTKGTIRCEAAATGERTQMGKVSELLEEIPDELTPLQKKLGELGKTLAFICVAVCFIVFAAGLIHGEPVFSMLMTGITIAIAAIPEGLPATVTIVLALAVRRMLKRNAFVHKLHSVETLGCASVICTDKTGTITENKMTVTKILTCENEFYVTGLGNSRAGEIRHNNAAFSLKEFPVLSELLMCGVLCNNGEIYRGEETLSSRNRGKTGQWCVNGDPTETAILIAAAKAGITASGIQAIRTGEIPFESQTRLMSVSIKVGKTDMTYTKGAVDAVLAKCDTALTGNGIVRLDKAIRNKLLLDCERLAGEALRVLGFSKTIGENSVFLGMMGMLDPPRAEAKNAVKTCAKAHIKTVMITGDHKITACEIARQAGIMHSSDIALTGDELSQLSDERLDDILDSISVFARVNPADKLRIVRAFKRKGHIVAMTGDGVNDAPAIKEADIGVAMGKTGTDVAKQASDVILTDDNFATLVNAVEQGRTIYANIRKFVRYLISCNIGEIITMFFGIILGLPMVLLPTQILLVNLATDGLPAVALGLEPTEESVMKRKPRKRDESFFSDGLLSRIVFRGILIGLCTLGAFVAVLRLGASVDVARTAALFTLVVSQLIHVFECKSENKSIFSVSYFSNPFLLVAVILSFACLLAAVFFPPLQLVFSTVPLNFIQLVIATGFALLVPFISAFISRI